MVNEIFMPAALGSNLKTSLLNLMNEIKTEMTIPYHLQLANISSIYKNKGSKFDLVNDRGIFILPVVRKMLDKLLYQDKYSLHLHFTFFTLFTLTFYTYFLDFLQLLFIFVTSVC